MKIALVFAAALLSILMAIGASTNFRSASAQEQKKMPDVLSLGPEAKLGAVRFSHTDHVTKNFSVEGSTVTCIECHHTAQPAAEVARHPPLKTAWPADRSTTLTADLFSKDANAAGVAACRDCHARANTKPKLMADIPQIKLEVGTELVTLNNQQAFHRNCAGCHDEIVKTNKDLNPPTSMKCIACHKRA
ncbi:MAG TPA: cytochrome c3 family protein [Pyrinomonadaceae bacterium]